MNPWIRLGPEPRRSLFLMRRGLWLGIAAAAGAGALATRRAIQESRRISLEGRVALVTGGSRGLGLLVARELLWRGARVALCARDAAELDAARRWLGAGSEVLTVACDVSDVESVARMAAAVRERLGPVDVLVNNAGVISTGPSESLAADGYRAALDVMFWGAFNCAAALLPEMKRRGFGRICNLTSVGGKVPVPHLSAYSAARFAAVGFSETLGAELASSGVMVTTVVPGLMRTGPHLAAFFEGGEGAEYRWLTAAASLPLLSMDVERAAAHVVDAIERGQRERTLTVAANLAVRAHGVAPGTTVAALSLVNRLLPPPGGGDRGAGAATGRSPAPAAAAAAAPGDRTAGRLESPGS